MCGGASSSQRDVQEKEAAFYQKQMDAYDTAYSNFQDINKVLKAQFEPILAKGPNQFGYSAGETNALRTQAGEGTAQGFAQAQRALQQRIAAQGGGTGGGVGNVNLASGGSQDLQTQLASAAAAEQSKENLGITTAGYDVGRQNYAAAVGGEQGLAAGWNPNSFAGSTINAGNSYASQANTIAAQQNQMWGSVLGALGGIGGAAAGGWTSGLAKGGIKMPSGGGGSPGGSGGPYPTVWS
jgi:hypothetical protein